MRSVFLLLSLMLLLTACGPDTHIAKPEPGIAVYIIPAPGPASAELETLAAQLANEQTYFIHTAEQPGTDEAAHIALSELSETRSFPEFDLIMIILPENVTVIPYEDLKQSDPAKPALALISGTISDKLVTAVSRRLAPDAYIFISDHYEALPDIKGAPAVRTGYTNGTAPFTGDFAHLLKAVVKGKTSITLRPLDADGYLLKHGCVTSSDLSKLAAYPQTFIAKPIDVLEPLTSKAVSVEQTYTLYNPFSEKLTLQLMHDPEASAWRVTWPAIPIILAPGTSTEVTLKMHIDDFAQTLPGPQITLQMTIGRSTAPAQTFELPLNKLPNPGRLPKTMK